MEMSFTFILRLHFSHVLFYSLLLSAAKQKHFSFFSIRFEVKRMRSLVIYVQNVNILLTNFRSSHQQTLNALKLFNFLSFKFEFVSLK